jgi:hypothetical protein
MAKRKGKPRGTLGRKPTGLEVGERLSGYPRLTVRVPPRVVELLVRTATQQGRPQWRVLVDAITEYAVRVLK